MSAIFFPVTRQDVREHPRLSLLKLRKGGVTGVYRSTEHPSEGAAIVRTPFYRQEVRGFDLIPMLKDAGAEPSFLYFTIEDFIDCPARARVPERFFRRYYVGLNSFFVGTVRRSRVITGIGVDCSL